MYPKCKERAKSKKILGYVINAVLAVLLIYAAVYLLRKGTIFYRPESQKPLGILAALPFLLRPRKRATAFELAVHDILVLLSASSFALLLTEYVVKGGIIVGNTAIWQGYIAHAAIFGLVYVFVGSIRWTTCIGMGLTLLYALIDHYVTVFRGTPVLLSDIFAIGTAKNVAANYSVPVELSVLQTLAIAVLFCVAVWRMRRASTPRRCQFITASLLLCSWLYGLQLVGNSFGFWQGNLEYSEWYYFCRTAGNAIVKRPTGYSSEALTRITEEYGGTKEEFRPNIIMIMNESFADLHDVGNFETNEDYLPFLHSLEGKENTITGDLLVSTFGGGTATTEFEVLTGDTMAFLPYGSSPYQMYVKRALPGLVSGLAAQGYQTVSLHPYLATSWNRQQVYERLGFDTQLYEDAFGEDDTERLRSYVSDRSDYYKIFEVYRYKNPGTPLFMFNVTMQNHGGYIPDDSDNFTQTIHLTGEYAGKYPEVDEYLSLAKESDKAIEELLAYFSEVDEPTAIIFLGDHQPNVPSAFYDELLGDTDEDSSGAERQKKMVTPFFIWANYDIEEQQDVQISANYLTAFALDALGCSTSGYDALRLAVREQIPRINNAGYYLPDGSWNAMETVEPDTPLADYQMMQYAQLFDATKQDDTWYEP